MAEETGSAVAVEVGNAVTTIRAVGDQPLKLDLGCGKNKMAGFVGIDALQFEGVDHVVDLRQPWPVDDNSVDEVHCSHFLEHLTGAERIQFFTELNRVMKTGEIGRAHV